MKINLNEIYAQLKAWRHERGITAESQKQGYIVNVMEELGELATALREYERFSKPSYPYPKNKKYAEHEIIDALCDICVFTINAGADVDDNTKAKVIDITKTTILNSSFSSLLSYCGDYAGYVKAFSCFNDILLVCAKLCENYGFDFQIAMLETIKEISSRTGSYDEVSKKWVKDESDEAKAKWYQANYELARIEK